MKKFYDSILGKITVILVCPVIVIVIAAITTVITVNSMGGTSSTTEHEIVLQDVELASSTDGISGQLLREIADDTADGNPKIATEKSISLTEVTLENEDAANVLKYFINTCIGDIYKGGKEISFDYGEDASDFMTILPADEPTAFEIDRESNENEVKVTLTYDPGLFETDEFRAAVKETADGLSTGIITDADDYSIESVTYSLWIPKKTQKISAIEQTITVVYDGDAEFTGNLASFGTVKAGAKAEIKNKYNISYAGIIINTDYLELSKGGYDTLDITANMAEGVADDEWTIEFVSSDESVATVDTSGQVTAVCEEGECTVTARLTYLGHTYEDSCPIYVVKD